MKRKYVPQAIAALAFLGLAGTLACFPLPPIPLPGKPLITPTPGYQPVPGTTPDATPSATS